MDQLELISPNGDVEFYPLDPAKGISNIGRHAENDIVIDHPDIAYFHAVIDHREPPYNIVVLSDESPSMLNGEAVSQNVAKPFRSWDTMQLGGFTMILVTDDQSRASNATKPVIIPMPAVTRRQESATRPTRPINTGRQRLFSRSNSGAYIAGAGMAAAGVGAAAMNSGNMYQPPESGMAAGQFQSAPTNIVSETVITDISEHEWVLDVEQYASCEVTIINGGDLVAAFETQVIGLNPHWVSISNPLVNLNEGDRTTVTITISPPRHPSSRSGAHFFAIRVTSFNYPEEESQHGAVVTINPYYDFTVGELAPKQQNIAYTKRSGRASISLFNRGNSKASFRIDAEDDERGCSFELTVPGEAVSLARQAELTLLPEEQVTIPIQITPYNRTMIAVRGRSYSYTVTANLLNEQYTPRSVLGRVTSKPLVGPWILFVMAFLMMLLCALMLKPRIHNFYIPADVAGADDINSKIKVINAGETVNLYWNASWFANWSIHPGIGAVTAPEGTATVMPNQNTTYEFKAENFLSSFAPSLFEPAPQAITVYVTPVLPNIEFSVDRSTIIRGQSINMFLDVLNAEEVVLRNEEGSQDLEPAQYRQAIRREAPNQTTTYELAASNQFGVKLERRTITVLEPTATPVPTPQLLGFSVDKTVVPAGENLTLSWAFPDADRVILQPLGIQLPASGSYSHTPTEDTSYYLQAEKAGTNGFISPPIQVFVEPPTPTPTGTPEPLAPIIDFFTISESEIIRGEPDNTVTLAWSITGETTNVQLSGSPNIDTLNNLAATGSLDVLREESTTFVLTAYNSEDKKNSKTLQLSVIEPTPTAVPSATATPTSTPYPNAIIRSFTAESADGSTAEVRQIGQTSDSRTYEVLAGSRVTLKWVVDNASAVTSQGTSDYQGGSEPLNGSAEFTVRTEGTYTLIATDLNADASQTLSFVYIRVEPRVPPAPSSVNGTEYEDEDRIELTWDFTGEDSEYMLGFRIYRAEADDSQFRRIVTEADLDSNSRKWDDTDLWAGTCGKIYYLTSVYLDPATSSIEETDSSSNSWYSKPCNN